MARRGERMVLAPSREKASEMAGRGVRMTSREEETRDDKIV